LSTKTLESVKPFSMEPTAAWFFSGLSASEASWRLSFWSSSSILHSFSSWIKIGSVEG